MIAMLLGLVTLTCALLIRLPFYPPVALWSAALSSVGVTKIDKPQVATVRAEIILPTPPETPSPTPTATPTPSPTPKPSSKPKPKIIALATTTPVTSTATPTATPTVTPTPSPTAPVDLEALFTKYSDQYHIDKDLLKRIAQCESGMNPKSGGNGYYRGMYQFAAQSWATVRQLMGLSTDDSLRNDPEEAIKTAAYMISKGEQSSWPSCK